MKNASRRALIGCAGLVVLTAAACTSTDTSAPSGGDTAGTVSASVVQPSSQNPAAVSTSASSSSGSASSLPTSAAGSSASVAIPITPTTTPTKSSAAASGEEADRAAVEAQWIKFWKVYGAIARTPATQRDSLIAQLAVDPTASNVRTNANSMDEKGLDTYGRVVHHVFWQFPIAGTDNAVIADCQDQSGYGSIETATGKKKTVGISKDNMRGEFVKGDDGVWRVRQIYFLTDTSC